MRVLVLWSLAIAVQVFGIVESVVVSHQAPAVRQVGRSCLMKKTEPTVRTVVKARDNWKVHLAMASDYNQHDGPCWDNITMIKLQMILDETEDGENQTKKAAQGYFKNVTRCWEPVIVNRDRNGTHQNTALYKHKDSNTCALAWSGVLGGKKEKSQTAASFFSARMEDFCGYTMPESWVMLMKQHTNLADFKKLIDYAASPACSGGVKVTGFSRGSDFATLLTACAMEGKLQELNPDFPTSFPVDSLWNYGSLGTTLYQPIYNKTDPNGCIKGQRIIVGDMVLNRGFGHLDFAPYGGNFARFFPGSFGRDLQHAATELVELVDIPGGYQLRTYPCEACDTITRPAGLLGLTAAVELHRHNKDYGIGHDSYQYIDFLEEMHDLPRPLPQDMSGRSGSHYAD